MKNLFVLLLIATAFQFTSCEGDPGPPGEPGINILGQVFEVTVDFQFNPNTGLQERVIVFPSNIEVFESDAVLVYRLEKQVDINGIPTDAWSPLPQNFFLSDTDIIQYVFNHTFVDLELLIDGNFDLATLGSSFTNDQIFRIAIVPSEFGTSNLSMEDLLQNINFEEVNIETLSD